MRDKKRDEINKKRYIMRDEIDQKECKNKYTSPPPPPAPSKKKKKLWTVVSKPCCRVIKMKRTKFFIDKENLQKGKISKFE